MRQLETQSIATIRALAAQYMARASKATDANTRKYLDTVASDIARLEAHIKQASRTYSNSGL